MTFETGKKWHYVKNGEAAGPVMGDEIARMAASGMLLPTTKIWTPGLTQWVDAGTYPQLFAGQGSPPPVPPQSPNAHAGVSQMPHAAHGMAQPADTRAHAYATGDVDQATQTTTTYASEAEVRTERDVRYGGFWIRVVAYILDVIILGGLAWAAERFLQVSVYTRGFIGNLIPMQTFETFQQALRQGRIALSRADFLEWTSLSAAGLLLSILYFVLLHASPLQATIGKAILGLRLITRHGDNVGLLRSLWRYIASFFSSLLLGLGYLLAGLTREKTALHDLLAGTRVIYRRR